MLPEARTGGMTRPLLVAALLVSLAAVSASGFGSAKDDSPGVRLLPFHEAMEGPPTASAAAPADGDLQYRGGAVQVLPKVYLVFWGWGFERDLLGNACDFGAPTTGPRLVDACGTVTSDPAGEAPYLIRFFQGVGGSSWANVMTQYYQEKDGVRTFIANPANQLAGVWFDDANPPPVISGSPLLGDPTPTAMEARNAAAHFGYEPDADYIIALPHTAFDPFFPKILVPATVTDLEHARGLNLPPYAPTAQYCAWHSATLDALGNPIPFTHLPYIPDAGTYCGKNWVNPGPAGALDGVSIVAGHEYAEVITDPFPVSGWFGPAGENADACSWDRGIGDHAQNIVLPTGTFAVQALWSNAAHACAIGLP